MEKAAPSGEAQTIYMVDSCPIMLARRSRSGYAKVAGDLCAKAIIPRERNGIMA